MGEKVARVRMTGPLTKYAPGFATELKRVGYTENSTADQMRLLAHLSHWLSSHGLSVAEITPEVGDTSSPRGELPATGSGCRARRWHRSWGTSAVSVRCRRSQLPR